MWKFRTMYRDADKRLDEVKAQYGNDMDGPIFKLEHDPRIFPSGASCANSASTSFPSSLMC